MTRKGGHNGQGAKKCSDLGIRLFGVQLTKGVMRKSISMGNLSHYSSNTNQASSTVEHSESGAMADGYLSDGIVQTSGNCRERRKGVPWTEEEHRLFLIGLQKLGKGDWRGIARNFVTTRTATQVASHAQKYFIRQSNFSKKKRRSSLFDILPESEANVSEDPKTDFTDMSPPLSQLSLGQGSLVSSKQFVDHTQVPVLQIPLSTVPLHSTLTSSGLTSRIMPSVQDSVSFVQNIADYTLAEAGKYQDNVVSTTGEPVNVKLSSLLPTLLPESFSFWLGLFPPPSFPQKSTIVKPIATLSSAPLTIDHPSEISELAPGMNHNASIKPSPLSLKLNQPSRSSAFHVKKSFRSSNSLSGDKLNEPISVV